MTDLDAEYFSRWYADMGTGPDKDRIWAAALGLPDGFLSTSLLTGPGLDEVGDLLGLAPDDVLLDLACGRGGYGLELARRSGARVIGVDFAAAAVEQAIANARAQGLSGRADFRVGDMTATDLADGSVTAVLCVDAAQFPQPFGGPLVEAHRVLVPGGKAVFTGWEARDSDAEVPERIRQVHFARGLRSAGFADVEVTSRDDWLAAERRAWQTVVDLPVSDDPATTSMQDEGRVVLARDYATCRTLAVGVKA